jgi:general stress protein 26
MADLKLADLSKKMKDIDFAMLSTHTEGGQIAARPMSNNREVEYDGDSFYFAWEQSRIVSDIQREPKVALSFQENNKGSDKPPMMIAVEGQAEVIRDKGAFKKHWTPDLDRWFDNGIDSSGIVMIKVHATRIHYWNGQQQGELQV